MNGTARFYLVGALHIVKWLCGCARGLHSLAPGAGGASLVLFGGAPKSGPMLGDLWALDLAPDLAWREIDPDGQAPHVRCSHAVAAVGDDVFFAGGSYYK